MSDEKNEQSKSDESEVDEQAAKVRFNDEQGSEESEGGSDDEGGSEVDEQASRFHI